MRNFEKVNDNLYRGSAPCIKDLIFLKGLGIKKIVSLDLKTGSKIDRACKLLDIKHEMYPIVMEKLKSTLLELFKHNIKNMLESNGPVFVHCRAGKDRTGLIVGIYRGKYCGDSFKDIMNDNIKLGFGIGIDPKATQLFTKLIAKSCSEDVNHLIFDNYREPYTEFGSQSPLSFAPYLDVSRNPVYNWSYEQSDTRQNHNNKIDYGPESDSVPQVGIYNSDAGGKGSGFVEGNIGGFIYD